MYLLSQEIKEVRNNIPGRLIPPHSIQKGGLYFSSDFQTL